MRSDRVSPGRAAAGAAPPQQPLIAGAPQSARIQLLAAFGPDYLSIESLFDFCFIPWDRLNALKTLGQPEEWGDKGLVLLKYLAIHLRMEIEQGLFAWSKDHLVLRAGQLVTTAGKPICLGLVRNAQPEETPWMLNWVGERPGDVESLKPVDLGAWPALDPRSEVVVACDLTRSKLGGLADLPVVTQISAIAGSVEWSLRRGLAVRHIHGITRGYFAPVHLTKRDDAPEIVAALQVQSGRVVVRTLPDPRVAYAPARAVVERREELPAWLLDTWKRGSE